MSDVNYALVSIPKHARAMAERMAVLRPVSGLVVTADASTGAAAVETLRLWRYRCTQLRDAGWPTAQGTRFQFLRNCPPAGVEMKSVGRTARLRYCTCAPVCPWCWSRTVVARSFDVVSATMAAMGEAYVRGAVPAYAYKLVVLSQTGRVDDSPVQPVALLDRVSGTMRQLKRSFGKVAAGFGLLGVVSPGKTGWTYAIRVVALVPREYVPKSPHRAYEHPTKRNLAKAVARFAGYPVRMMRGDTDRTVRLLDARAPYRLLRFSGVFAKLHGRAVRPEGLSGPVPDA